MFFQTTLLFTMATLAGLPGMRETRLEDIPQGILSQLNSVDAEWLRSTLLDIDESFGLLCNSFDLDDAQRTGLKSDLYQRLVLQAAYEEKEAARMRNLSTLIEQTQDEVEKKALEQQLMLTLSDFAKHSPLSVFNVADKLASALPRADADAAFRRLAALIERQRSLNQAREADLEGSAGKKQLLLRARTARRTRKSPAGKPVPHLDELGRAKRVAATTDGTNAHIVLNTVVGIGVFRRASGDPDLHGMNPPAAGRLDSDLRRHARQDWVKMVQQRTRSDQWTDAVRGRANALLEEFLRRSDPARLGDKATPAVFSALSQEFGQRLAMLSEHAQ